MFLARGFGSAEEARVSLLASGCVGRIIGVKAKVESIDCIGPDTDPQSDEIAAHLEARSMSAELAPTAAPSKPRPRM
jgi:hypothetical protein